jgi:hypothetical protein
MDKQTPPNNVPFIEDLHAPELFAPEAVGFFFNQGNVHITFAAPRSTYHQDGSPIVSRVVNLRVIMPIGSAEDLVRGLVDFVQANRQLNPVKPPDTRH